MQNEDAPGVRDAIMEIARHTNAELAERLQVCANLSCKSLLNEIEFSISDTKTRKTVSGVLFGSDFHSKEAREKIYNALRQLGFGL